jgi:hypothetical protein
MVVPPMVENSTLLPKIIDEAAEAVIKNNFLNNLTALDIKK